jgi:hypothetical protein
MYPGGSEMEQGVFSLLPRNVKIAIIFLFGSWAFFIISAASFYGQIPFMQATLGIFCCVIVYSIRNWGRIVCIVYNILVIVASFHKLYSLNNEGFLFSVPTLMAVINIGLFSITTYYLLAGETVRFFKEYGAKKEPTGEEKMKGE